MIVTKLEQLPDLRGAKQIATDCETVDPNLLTLGPGDLRGDGRIVGVAVAVPGKSWYLPLGHDDPRQNLPRAGAVKWLKAVHGQVGCTYYGANLMYDMGWYAAGGFQVAGTVRDVLHAGRLLDMDGKYPSLDELLRHLGARKTGDTLWVWLANKHGGEPTRKAQIGRLATSPARLVGEYAQGDVANLFALHDVLEKKLRERHAWEWYLVEEELLPVCHAMRQRGIPVNVKAAEQLCETWEKRYEKQLHVFGKEVYGAIWGKLSGAEQLEYLDAVKPRAALGLDSVYARRGIKLPRTATGLPSVTKTWLRAQGDPLSKMILELRALSVLKGTFVEGYVLKHVTRGYIHPTLKQLWPRTLRLSSENPSEQNIPKRDEELAPLVRGLFLPEDGEQWLRYDYSQQEYRLLVHNAVGPGAKEARQRYMDNPAMDFHAFVQGLFKQVAKRDITERVVIKNANFAKTYRAGKAKFASMLGLGAEEGAELFQLYDQVLPFVKETGAHAQRVAETDRGDGHYVKLLLKDMRLYFDRWEINDWDVKNQVRDEEDLTRKAELEAVLWRSYATEEAAREAAKVFDKARAKVGRAGTYKALNTVIQPSAAQQIKWAMVSLARAGVLGVPLVSVHDELDFSWDGNAEAAREAQHILEHCTDAEMRVPMRAGVEVGPDWGHLTGVTL